MSAGVIFALLVAVAAALYAVFARSAAQHVDALFGAILISSTALVSEIVLILPRAGRVRLHTDTRGIVFAVLAGLCAIGIDYLSLRAYASGLRVSVGAPIIIGGGIALATLFGLALGERLDALKAGGVVLVLAGATLLAASNR